MVIAHDISCLKLMCYQNKWTSSSDSCKSVQRIENKSDNQFTQTDNHQAGLSCPVPARNCREGNQPTEISQRHIESLSGYLYD